MVFESLINPKIAEKKPFLLFIMGFIYTSIAIFLGNYVFPGNSSLPIVFLTTLFFVPLFYKTMIYEEKKDLDENSEKSLLKEHSKAINFFMFLFVGITVSYMVWFLVFSSGSINLDANTIYKVQADTVAAINGRVVEQNISRTLSNFIVIFENNLKVLIFCILFSFIYGAGAIFVLTWNASVIGFALGNYALSIINTSTGVVSMVYLQASTLAFLRYFIHGIPEIIAYFVGGLAGGIVSVAIIKHDFNSEKIEKIMLDVSSLILIAVAILIFSAIVEVWITPAVMRFVLNF